jgi:hypothetical protein
MRYRLYASIVTILVLSLITTSSVNSVNPVLQKKALIQSMGNIASTRVSNFADKVFFEYGAESEVLQPPWDEVEAKPFDSKHYLEISSTHARTGSKSIYMYQDEGPKSNAQRRVRVAIEGESHQRLEGYFSFWVYCDDQITVVSEDLSDNWGPNLGGWQIFFGPSSNTGYWWTGGRFGILRTSKKVTFTYSGCHVNSGYERFSSAMEAQAQSWTSDFSYNDVSNRDRWVQYQVYWKIATNGNGIVRAWVDGKLIAEKTDITTDPRGFSEWNYHSLGQCYMSGRNPGGYPKFKPEMYAGTNSAEIWYWVDDVVAATEKVPESYKVFDE